MNDNWWYLDLAGDGNLAEKIVRYGVANDRYLSGNWGAYAVAADVVLTALGAS